jgi:hypothetical protein
MDTLSPPTRPQLKYGLAGAYFWIQVYMINLVHAPITLGKTHCRLRWPDSCAWSQGTLAVMWPDFCCKIVCSIQLVLRNSQVKTLHLFSFLASKFDWVKKEPWNWIK